MRDAFLQFSARLTGFSVFELEGTGQASSYFETVERILGPELLQQLLGVYRSLSTGEEVQCEERLRREILGDPLYGPVARSVIKLWYLGIWYQLPSRWSETYGPRDDDRTFRISASSYTEALLWPTVGSNPPGAKAPGYGSWAAAPVIPVLSLTDKRGRGHS